MELAKILGQQNRLQRERQKATFLDIEQRYRQLHEIGCSYPVEYLLFDFCLTALDEDYLDAYDGFIDGCMDADNSRDVCESATDAGE